MCLNFANDRFFNLIDLRITNASYDASGRVKDNLVVRKTSYYDQKHNGRNKNVYHLINKC